eukprot:5185244-Alexandrium_andersonii.AAC.1
MVYVGLSPRRGVLPPLTRTIPAPNRDLDLSTSELDAMGGRPTSGTDVNPDTTTSSTGNTMLSPTSCPRPSPPPPSAEEGSGAGG